MKPSTNSSTAYPCKCIIQSDNPFHTATHSGTKRIHLFCISEKKTIWSCAAFCFGSEQKVRSQAFDKRPVWSVVTGLHGLKKSFLNCSCSSSLRTRLFNSDCSTISGQIWFAKRSWYYMGSCRLAKVLCMFSTLF